MRRHPREGWKAAREYMEVKKGRPVTRRDFLRTSAGTAVTIPTLAAILASCTNPRTEASNGENQNASNIATPDNPVTLPITVQPIADGLEPEKGATLQIYNWDAYMWKRIIDEFCAQYDCKYEWTTFSNMEEAVAKVQTGQLDFDVFFPTYDQLGKLVQGKYLQPLNHTYIPNLSANVWDYLQDPFYDQGSQYSVPYTVYSTGIAYRRDVITDEEIHSNPNPRAMLWDPKYKDKVGVYDSERDTIAFALQKLGIQDVNTEDPAQITQAKDALLELIDLVNVRASINGAYARLPKGDFDIHESWSGDIVAGWGYVSEYTEQQFEDLGFWFPEDRTGPTDNDLIAIGATAQNPVLAHKFLDFFLDYQHAMDNFSWNGYQPPQKKADVSSLTTTEGLFSKVSNWAPPITYVPKWMPDAVVTEADLKNGKYRLHELSTTGDELWSNAWQEFQAGA